MLAEWFARIRVRDERVAVGPRVGEDAAAIAFGDQCLIVSTAPITFAADRLGWYAVHVNANDAATMGAPPRWFLATLLLPEARGARTPFGPKEAEAIFTDVLQACEGLGVAIEATAILARERAAEVADGFGPAFQRRAAAFLDAPGISVVAPAMVAAALPGVRAMHDPTEGGMVTALRELAEAAGAGVRVRREAIPVYPECEQLCCRYGLDPLGALASGALLIVVGPGAADAVCAAVRGAGFPCVEIGELTPDQGRCVFASAAGDTPLPEFAADEVTKILSRFPVATPWRFW